MDIVSPLCSRLTLFHRNIWLSSALVLAVVGISIGCRRHKYRLSSALVLTIVGILVFVVVSDLCFHFFCIGYWRYC